MDDDGLVAEEVGRALDRGQVRFGVHGGEGRRGDVAVLASEIAGLAGLGSFDLTSVELAALGGVKMGHGSSAVAIGRDRELVNVVHCDVYQPWRVKEEGTCLPNGPYSAAEGKPVKLMLNITPFPSGDAETRTLPVMIEPVALSKLVSGRIAW